MLEWESLSLDIIPHPDMFDDDLIISAATAAAREEDGARRLFFGGERIVDNVAGKAFVSTPCHCDQLCTVMVPCTVMNRECCEWCCTGLPTLRSTAPHVL